MLAEPLWDEDSDPHRHPHAEYRAICLYWARRYWLREVPHFDLEDWLQEALIAAWKAHYLYDGASGIRRGVWISKHVRSHLGHRMEDFIDRIKRHETGYVGPLEYDLEALLFSWDRGPWGGAWFRPVDLRDCIEALEGRRREVIWRRYWLQETMEQIALHMHVGHSRASELHQEALSELRRALDVGEPESPGRIRSTQERCAHGHEWTSDTTYRRKDGKRDCKICINEQQRRRRAQRGPAMRVRTRHPVKVA